MRTKGSIFSGLHFFLMAVLWGCAFTQPASAGKIPWSAATGAPNIAVGKVVGFFIWHVGTQVYITAADDTKAGHIFDGRITVSGAKAKISGLTAKKQVSPDTFSQSNSTTVIFHFIVARTTDSLQFKLSGGTQLTFTAKYDTKESPNLINYGKTPMSAGIDPAVFDLTK
jgi:hypothetical protein